MKTISSLKKLQPYITDDTMRIRIQFLLIYGALFIISTVMTLVNLFTGRYTLMYSTLFFAAFCIINLWLYAKNKISLKYSSGIFIVAFFLLLTYFIISGNPEGFSVIWICLLPSWGLLVFGQKRGTIICAAMLIIILFFFRTSIGQSLVQYQYTASFKLRFPLLYIAFYILAFLLETIRKMTHDELVDIQCKYKYLYSHDALTGIFNRHGFNECLSNTVNSSDNDEIALIIIDVDQLKKINDVYGHINGDIVIKSVADTLVKNVPPGTSVCRWGGDEFAVLLYGKNIFNEISDNLCSVIRNTPIDLGTETINVTASLGVSIASCKSNCSANELVNCADKCLYDAKNNGKNQVICKNIEVTKQL